ncbi:hypothetical protein QFZ80_001499 [Paenibacillus sp. V4I7]|nr:hypothetical protein [Paenibacillus sp. V4I7]
MNKKETHSLIIILTEDKDVEILQKATKRLALL